VSGPLLALQDLRVAERKANQIDSTARESLRLLRSPAQFLGDHHPEQRRTTESPASRQFLEVFPNIGQHLDPDKSGT
jgi:hypothetical protein